MEVNSVKDVKAPKNVIIIDCGKESIVLSQQSNTCEFRGCLKGSQRPRIIPG